MFLELEFVPFNYMKFLLTYLFIGNIIWIYKASFLLF